PAPADGIDALARGGGVLGYLAAAPLEALVPPVAVIIIHSLVIALGVLVLTATPVESIPSRLHGVYEVMVGRSAEEDEERIACARAGSTRRSTTRPPRRSRPDGRGAAARRRRPRPTPSAITRDSATPGTKPSSRASPRRAAPARSGRAAAPVARPRPRPARSS